MKRREFMTLIGGAIIAALVAAIPALAHSWYPLACCGNMDCFPVACHQLVETGSGWFYDPTSNLFKREQVQPSQDHHCHVCLGRGSEHPSVCAFIVPNVCSRRSPASVGRTKFRDAESFRRITDYSSDFLGRPCAAANEMTASRLLRRAKYRAIRFNRRAV